jgi:phytoene synthase
VPARLLDGMEQDARGEHYRTYEQLLDYCFNVAGTVGLMMTYVMGHRMPAERSVEVALRAIDLGVAMQLSNIARDLGEDAGRGRVYLPDDFLSAFGLTFDEVLASVRAGAPAPPGLCRAVRELLLLAQAHYRAATDGIAMLPAAVRLAVRSAQLVYCGIAARLEDQDYDPLRGRVYVPLSGKLARVSLALTGLPFLRRVPRRPTSGPEDALWLRRLGEMGLLGGPIAPSAV